MTRTRLAAFSLSAICLACATTEATSHASSSAAAPAPSPAAAPPPAPAPGLDRARLDAFVRSRGGIKACYQEERARNGGAHGRVLVRFTVLAAGDVAEIAVLKSELSPRLVQCVTESMSNWQTPFRPTRPVTVDYPIVFTPD